MDNLPFVSVCTPTFNRRPFIQNMFECFKNQDYPKDKLEWIIVDDGTDKIKDLIYESNIVQIRYFEVENKMTLGAKRNYMHQYVRGSIIVYMDDDDYYPPERISHSVEMLTKNEEVLCAGSSEIYVYYKDMKKMMQAGPYGPNHATAGTFAFKTELLKQTHYNNDASLAEEREFLKGYTIPFVQLDPLKTILVFSHNHNTFDKRRMFDTSHPDFFKESEKTVESFIRNDFENNIKDFFLINIDQLLDDYKPGLPEMKPDVLKQIKVIEAQRKELIEQQKMAAQNGPIVMQQPGKEPIKLNSMQVIQIIEQQKQQIIELQKQNENIKQMYFQMQNTNSMLQQSLQQANILLQKHNVIGDLNNIQLSFTDKPKTLPDKFVNIK
jgi:glycosyltransferase involved in cell wall biosynthesis